MKAVWKYPVGIKDFESINVPKGAKFLCAKDVHNTLCLYYLVDVKAPEEEVRLWIVGTGHQHRDEDLDEANTTYLDTVVQGNFVWHIFHLTGEYWNEEG